MNPRLIGGAVAAAAIAAIGAAVVIGSTPMVKQSCEMLLPDGGTLSAVVMVQEGTVSIDTCVQALVTARGAP